MCYGTNCGREGAFGTCYHPEDCIMRAIERDAEENLAVRLARDTALSREHFPCPNCLEQGERHSLTCENGLFTCPECGKETEVWSRVVGYLRPVQNYHKGKREEYRQRVKYKIKENELEAGQA